MSAGFDSFILQLIQAQEAAEAAEAAEIQAEQAAEVILLYSSFLRTSCIDESLFGSLHQQVLSRCVQIETQA